MFMELSDKAVREICSCGEFRKLRRGKAVLCGEAKGKDAPNSLEFIGINEGEVCIGTEVYSTGHIHYDSEVDVEKMKTCPYRKSCSK